MDISEIELKEIYNENIILTYTYDELKKIINDSYDKLTEDQKHQKYESNDQEFDEYVFAQIKPGDTVEIDFTSYTFNIINS